MKAMAAGVETGTLTGASAQAAIEKNNPTSAPDNSASHFGLDFDTAVVAAVRRSLHMVFARWM
jgi:hypothetical protein